MFSANGFPIPFRPSNCPRDPDNTCDAVLLDLVLPDPYHPPAGSPQAPRTSHISAPSLRNFLPPESRQSMRPAGETPAMPEVSIDEHRHVLHWED